MAPHGRRPVTIPVIDGFDRGAVGPGEVLMKIEPAAHRIARGLVAAEFGIQAYSGTSQVIVAGGGAGGAVFAPVAVGALLLRGETVEHLRRHVLPVGPVE